MKFKSNIELQAGLKDSSGALGTSGQALLSTVSGVSWGTLPPGGVTSFNTRTGDVTLTSGDVIAALGYTPTNVTVNPANANGLSVAANQVLNLILASTSTNGALSSTDWNTFNSKVNGSGTTNYVSKFTSGSTLGNSQIFDNGTNVLIGSSTDENYGKLAVIGGDIIIDNNRQFNSKRADNLPLCIFKINTSNELVFNPAWGQAVGAYSFTFSGTERMRIFSSGTVFIGSSPTDAGFKLDINGTLRAQTSLTTPTVGANAVPNATYPITIGCTSGANGLKIIGRSDNLGYIEFVNNNGTTVNSSINGSTGGLQITGQVTVNSLAGTGTRIVTANSNGVLSTTTDGAVTTYNSVLTLSTSWQNTGVTSVNLNTQGVYLVSCFVNDNGVGGGQYSCTYVGTMFFYTAGTNGVNENEISLHHSGHADNGRYIYLRTLGSLGADSKLYLQIKGNGTNSGNSTYAFTFKKLL